MVVSKNHHTLNDSSFALCKTASEKARAKNVFYKYNETALANFRYYSTVTDFARFLGWSGLFPHKTEQ
jgi:hypothetical protein